MGSEMCIRDRPFALPELLSRVRNLLDRRQRHTEPANDESYEFAKVSVDFLTYQINVAGQTHDLTKTEMELLRYFIDNEGIVLTRHQILRAVWGEPGAITTRSTDNFVMRLRRMIEPNPSQPRHILSVRGTGYRFVASPSPVAGN